MGVAVTESSQDDTFQKEMRLDGYEFALISGNDVSLEQETFINRWTQTYFGEVTVSRGLSTAPVHWRWILSCQGEMVSHVAITELEIDFDGRRLTAGAVGALFTAIEFQGSGCANVLMDRAEEHIFSGLELPFGILFCLPALVPFYAKRQWTEIARPVSLQQVSGDRMWGAATMIVSPDKTQTGEHSIHVPNQPKH